MLKKVWAVDFQEIRFEITEWKSNLYVDFKGTFP